MPSPVVFTMRPWCSLIEELAPMRFEPIESAFLVRPHQSRVTRDIGGKDRGEVAGRGHGHQPQISRSTNNRLHHQADFRW